MEANFMWQTLVIILDLDVIQMCTQLYTDWKNLHNKAIHLLVLVASNNSIKAQEDLRRDYDYVDSPYRVFDILAFHY